MFDQLADFPLIISRFQVGNELGEMRLLFDPASVYGNRAKCRRICARIFKRSEWFLEPKAKLFPEETVTVEDVGDGAFEIKDGLIPILLKTLWGGREVKLSISLSLKFEPKTEVEGVWRLKGRIEAQEAGGWLNYLLVKWLSPEIEGDAWLFKEDLSQDASGKFRGYYYLRLVPISLNETGGGNLPASFCAQKTKAEELWAQANVRIIFEPHPRGIKLTPEIDYDLASGTIKYSLATAVGNEFPDGGPGVPVVLVDRVFKESGGDSIPGSPLTSFIVITNQAVKNPQLLAHEVGHVLGGEHYGDSAISPRWVEVDTADSVMIGTDSIEVEHPFKLGRIAKERAASWAFFEMIPRP